MQINSTQGLGLLAFGSAALLAAAAWRAARKGRGGWAVVALAQALFAAEVHAGWRHRAGLAAGAWLRAAGVYPERRPAQLALLLALAVAGAFAVRALARRRRGAGSVAPALAATAATAFLFAIESVSLHAVDALLYRRLGPAAVIGWLWLAGGLATAAAAWRALRR